MILTVYYKEQSGDLKHALAALVGVLILAKQHCTHLIPSGDKLNWITEIFTLLICVRLQL